MGQYHADTLVAVYPFTRQIEGEEIVIGRSDTSTFLVLSFEAVELLDYLSEGNTIEQAQQLYQTKYNEIPDLVDLLNLLENKGFVQPFAEQPDWAKNLAVDPNVKIVTTKTSRFHFTNFPQSLSQQIFSRQNLKIVGAFIGMALLAAIIEPSIIPGWDAYFFQENLTLMRLFLMLIGFLAVFLHEMAHLVAARALGISSRMGISNRMWMLVAETDMTGIWSISRNRRYLPFLAGPLLDAFFASIFALVFFAQKKGLIEIHPFVAQLANAVFLSYLLGLFWQCYLFVRTDFYFVIANFFYCKNLMKDTEVFLWNQLARFISSIRKVSQSHIPRSERRVIRLYALLWLMGRASALSILIFISLPLTWNYFLKISAIFQAGYSANPSAFIDALFMLAFVFIPQFLGIWLWIRSSRTTSHKLEINS